MSVFYITRKVEIIPYWRREKMPRVCEICGKGTAFGRTYAKRGLARRKKGAGIKITGIANRSFSPNLITKHVVVEGNKKKVRLCASCLKSGNLTALK
jgi:large subunit ribosomal protein L28